MPLLTGELPSEAIGNALRSPAAGGKPLTPSQAAKMPPNSKILGGRPIYPMMGGSTRLKPGSMKAETMSGRAENLSIKRDFRDNLHYACGNE